METKRELEAERKKLEDEIAKMEHERATLASTYNSQRNELQAQFDKARQDVDNYVAKINELERLQSEAKELSAAERERFERELQELRNRKPSGGCCIM